MYMRMKRWLMNKDYGHPHKVEDEEHFLIECPTYEEERKSLFESVSKLSIHFNDQYIFLTIASAKQALSYQ